MLIEIDDELYQVLKKAANVKNLPISDYIEANLYLKALVETLNSYKKNKGDEKDEKSFCNS